MMGNAPERVWIDGAMGGPHFAAYSSPDDCLAPHGPYARADPAPAPSWQPIETAPKDGTPVLVAGANFGDPDEGYHQSVAGWTQDERTPEQIKDECGEDFSGWYCDDNSDDKLKFLTHWMPLPAPPEAS